MRREPVFLYAIVVLLSMALSASLAGAATQTINTLPSWTSPPSSWASQNETFLRNEEAGRYNEHFDSYVESGGTHGTSASLTATISASVTYVGGFRVSAPATARTYTASRRTFIYVYSHDGAVAGDFTRSGGTGCSIPANGIVSITNGGSFVFVQCSTGSAMPTVTVAAQRGIAILMAVDTGGSSITATHPLKNPFPLRPSSARLHVDVREYGAVGDNVQDDTLAIQTAANAACNRVAPLFFPAGSYRISSPITSTNTCPLTLVYGAGYDQTFLYINSATSNGLEITQTAPVVIRDMRVENLITATAGACLRIGGPSATQLNVRSIIERVYLNGCWDGVDWTRSSNVTVQRSQILNFITTGIRAQSEPALADSGDNLIFGNEINPSTTTGTNIYVTSGGGLRILSNKLQNANIGVWLDWAGTQNSAQLLIENNSFDNPATNAISLDRQAGVAGLFGSVVIVGNFMSPPTTTTGETILSTTQTPATWLTGLTITGNEIGCNTAASAIRLASGNGVTIGGNTILCQAGTSTGISVGTGVANVTIGHNTFASVTTPINDVTALARIAPRMLFGSASLDFAVLPANSCEQLPITVTNARDGDAVLLEKLNVIAGVTNSVFEAFVSANDTVVVRRCNVSLTATADPAAATFGALVFDRNYLP